MSRSDVQVDLKKISGKDPASLPSDTILAIVVGRNEAAQIPWFLTYYRGLGVEHFLYVDNASSDDSKDILRAAPDVTLFHTDQGYLDAANGRHWSMFLTRAYAMGHWCLTLDLDEILVYPMSEHVGLREFTAWLEASGAEGLLTLMLDMYPETRQPYLAGDSFIHASPCFDRGPYWVTHSKRFPHVSFYGGMRHRMFFAAQSPEGVVQRNGGPVLRKVPLVKWVRGRAYLASTHAVTALDLPEVTGALLHFKLLKDFHTYAQDEVSRGQRNPGEYEDYLQLSPDEFWSKLHCPLTERYQDTAQLVSLGLMAAPKSYLEQIFRAARAGKTKESATQLWQVFKSARLSQASAFQPQIGHMLTDAAIKRGDL